MSCSCPFHSQGPPTAREGWELQRDWLSSEEGDLRYALEAVMRFNHEARYDKVSRESLAACEEAIQHLAHLALDLLPGVATAQMVQEAMRDMIAKSS